MSKESAPIHQAIVEAFSKYIAVFTRFNPLFLFQHWFLYYEQTPLFVAVMS